jgi:hypothetical protein
VVATIKSGRIFVAEGEKPKCSSNGHLLRLYDEATVYVSTL